MSNSLVGFLKSNEKGVQITVSWMKHLLGKMEVGVNLIGFSMVWIELLSEKEAPEVLQSVQCAKDAEQPAYVALESREMDAGHGKSAKNLLV